MANRTHPNQSLHDNVINAALNYLNQKDFIIYLNPNGYKNAAIGENYPDIILTNKISKNVAFIIEVETADSINIDEAKTEWKKYATEINASFYLLVPANKKNDAEYLCKQVGISVRFGTFQNDTYGNITNMSFE